MKISITFKDSDALIECINHALNSDAALMAIDDEEADIIRQHRKEKIIKLCSSRWFEYGEYLEVEVDTEAQTCTVVERG